MKNSCALFSFPGLSNAVIPYCKNIIVKLTLQRLCKVFLMVIPPTSCYICSFFERLIAVG